MVKKVLVDTCVWIEYFRGNKNVTRKLTGFIQNDIVYTSGIVLFEIFQGVKNNNEREILEDAFKGIHFIEMTRETWLNASVLSMNLRASGFTIPPTDIFLAQIAIENNLKIYTVDPHFKMIKGVYLV